MTKPKPKPTAQSEKTRLEILLERKDRHLVNVAKIEAVLARQTAFLAFGSKAKARAKLRDLITRQILPPADLKALGLAELTPADEAEIQTILGLFRQHPWAEKDHAPTEPKA